MAAYVPVINVPIDKRPCVDLTTLSAALGPFYRYQRDKMMCHMMCHAMCFV